MKKIIVAMYIILILLFVTRVYAGQDEKVYWCHCASSGVCNTLHLPLQALEQAGHVSAQGNPLHAGDHAGACIDPTATPTPTACVSPSPTVTPTITPTPDPTITPTVTPTVTPEPTSTPSATVSPSGSSEGVSTTGGHSSSCPYEVGNVPWFRVEQGVPNDGKMEIYWSDILSADHVNIYYGEEKGKMTHSVIQVADNGHFTIGGLVNGQHYWFTMQGVDGDCAGPLSEMIDPLP